MKYIYVPFKKIMEKSVDNKLKEQVTTVNRLISIVVPAYNEQNVLKEFHRRVSKVLECMTLDAEIIFVNDGSTDDTLKIIQDLRKSDERVSILDLSRNFGKEAAMTAGLDHASGEAVVLIDADLQHPPELLPELVKYWIDGFDVVYTTNVERFGEGIVKRATTYAFYRLVKRFSRIDIPVNASDYRLLSRRAVDSLKQLREQHRFMKGLFSWIGYSQKSISYRPETRYGGETKWSYSDLWNLALEAITSFTIAPLKLATYFGLVSAVTAFIYGTITIYQTLVYGNPVAGYPSLLVVILFLGGVQLITIGIIGEYLGRIFDETKRRPIYFVKGYEPSSSFRKIHS